MFGLPERPPEALPPGEPREAGHDVAALFFLVFAVAMFTAYTLEPGMFGPRKVRDPLAESVMFATLVWTGAFLWVAEARASRSWIFRLLIWTVNLGPWKRNLPVDTGDNTRVMGAGIAAVGALAIAWRLFDVPPRMLPASKRLDRSS